MSGTCTPVLGTHRVVPVIIRSRMGGMPFLHEVQGILQELADGRDHSPKEEHCQTGCCEPFHYRSNVKPSTLQVKRVEARRSPLLIRILPTRRILRLFRFPPQLPTTRGKIVSLRVLLDHPCGAEAGRQEADRLLHAPDPLRR